MWELPIFHSEWFERNIENVIWNVKSRQIVDTLLNRQSNIFLYAFFLTFDASYCNYYFSFIFQVPKNKHKIGLKSHEFCNMGTFLKDVTRLDLFYFYRLLTFSTTVVSFLFFSTLIFFKLRRRTTSAQPEIIQIRKF